VHDAWVAIPVIAAVIILKMAVYNYGQKKRDEAELGSGLRVFSVRESRQRELWGGTGGKR
jgi:hypothetical protein